MFLCDEDDLGGVKRLSGLAAKEYLAAKRAGQTGASDTGHTYRPDPKLPRVPEKPPVSLPGTGSQLGRNLRKWFGR